MLGALARIGIKKGKPFKPDAKLQAMFDQAGPEALKFMIEQYHRDLNPWMWEGKRWSMLAPPGVLETDFTYEFPSYYDYHARGALFYAIITTVKNYGTATFYLDNAETAGGEWLEGDKNYKLVMPPDVPVRDFWAITTYDLETASYIRNMEKSSIDSHGFLHPQYGEEQHRLTDEGGQEERRWFGGYLLRARAAQGQGEQLASHRPETAFLPARPVLRTGTGVV
jgi:hypothetical protein